MNQTNGRLVCFSKKKSAMPTDGHCGSHKEAVGWWRLQASTNILRDGQTSAKPQALHLGLRAKQV